MPKKSIIVEVNPEVLKWLRESSGWKIEEVSKRLNTSVEIVTAFENGTKSPTLAQLKILSEIFKRPLASFFYPNQKKKSHCQRITGVCRTRQTFLIRKQFWQ